ncbi:MAG: hypothetical protein PW788_06250 [Micavibrio sp.]|nr:hypothetical protein [Micavibrio sp.]
MISESVLIFGATGNVVMVINGSLPRNVPIMFKVGASKIDLVINQDVLYSERGLSPYICQKLAEKNEIGLLEVIDSTNPPRHLTNIAYHAS